MQLVMQAHANLPLGAQCELGFAWCSSKSLSESSRRFLHFTAELSSTVCQNTYESSLSKNKASALLLHSPSPLSMSHLFLTLSLLKVSPSTARLAFKHFKFHNMILIFIIFMCSVHSLHSLPPRHFALAAAKGFPRETMITPCKGPH